MKNIKCYLITLIIFGLLFTTTSCEKKDPVTKITQVLSVSLIPNLVPITTSTPGIFTDFSINGTIYATSVGYNTSIDIGTIRYRLPYFTLEPKSGSVIAYNETGTLNKIASVTKDLEENKVYSTFLIGYIQSARAVIVNDDLSGPRTGKVKLRFFHFSPNAPAIDVVLSGTSTKLFANRSFNDQESNTAYEKFIEIDPGTYTFQFNNATTGANLHTTSGQVLLTDRIYTFAARGVIGNTTSPIGGWLYANKP